MSQTDKLHPIVKITLLNTNISKHEDYGRKFMLTLISGLIKRTQRLPSG